MMAKRARRVAGLAIVVVLALAAPGLALRIAASAGDLVSIRLLPGEPCLVTFPAAVEAITTAASQEAVSVELFGERMFVQLLAAGYETRMFVLLADGDTHYLRLADAAIDGGAPDTRVRLVAVGGEDEAVAPGTVAAPGPVAARPGGGLRRLLLAMMRGDAAGTGLKGIEMSAVLMEIADQVRVTARAGYPLENLLGVVAEAQNLSGGVLHLRLPEYRAKGLRAISALDERLAPGGRTVMWMVFAVGAGASGLAPVAGP